MRSNKTMLDRKNLKGMVRALKEGEILWYAPDHDYGPASSVFAPLFAVEQAATTTGTWDAGENVRGDDCAVCSAAQAQRHGV
ncbi:lipid A biosynthesis (KDO) 2-(lauroyl)-lipid IVA acyltransferase [Klebsiella pneumoniae]|uniref:Lipid A biosynthesis (KDO) 2-(Lauroyl)-lipid IVA acyltransferase n=2 Tax=Klebsiella pneumoniae TaxID=573 RepID=A0A3S4HYJ6_KLEPN|nr:lipid A biosynthesis (KDO) 2-(lauroyl)-lipid IVA acyltransferase [Klebsiella pneumoniae]